mmetsp:Transcript_18237/g.34734  ORF Transcript_18237/g.34734 Transcript_18237/m.34734 type:complete len:256 (-) Transcript_18237:236-1003(-)
MVIALLRSCLPPKRNLIEYRRACRINVRSVRALAMASTPQKTALVVWLHGLGDTGRGWSDVESSLGPKMPHVKWVFPDAPIQPVACNGRMRMPSWFDLPTIPLEPGCAEDPQDFQSAIKGVHQILANEMIEAGVGADRTIIGGFSQGGAIAIQAMLQYPEKMAGGACFSGWLVDAAGIESRLAQANKQANRKTPLLWCHGDADPTVVPACQKEGITVLGELGCPLTYHSYPDMGHSACNSELQDLAEWINKQLPA